MEGVTLRYFSVLEYFFCILYMEVYHIEAVLAGLLRSFVNFAAGSFRTGAFGAEAFQREALGNGGAAAVLRSGKAGSKKGSADRTIARQSQINARAEKILDTYGNSILRLAYSYLHNQYDAEEILQETLIKFLTGDYEFENSAHEKAWLMSVAANLSKNRIRYNQVRDADELDETLAQEEQEDLAFVWEAVKMLPEKYREVVHLFYYEGYSTGQIAQILKRKESSVRSDLSRGRARLKSVLQEAYDFA